MSAVQRRIEELKSQFAQFSNWESKYQHVIELGKGLSGLTPEEREARYLVKGCQSQVWLIAGLENGHITLKADSDAVIVRGLVSLLVLVFNGSTPAEVLSTPPDFLKELGFFQALSPSRANGLNSMINEIYRIAQAYELLSKVKG